MPDLLTWAQKALYAILAQKRYAGCYENCKTCRYIDGLCGIDGPFKKLLTDLPLELEVPDADS